MGHRHRCTGTLSVSAVGDIRTRWKSRCDPFIFRAAVRSSDSTWGRQLRTVFKWHLGGYFWENIFTLVPFVVSIPVAASFVAGKLESGAFAWILSAPVEREKLLFTQIYSFTFALFALFFVNCLVGIVCGLAFCGSYFVISEFLLMCLGGFCLHFCLGGLLFVISAMCDEKALAVMITTGIVLLFYILKMLASLGGIFGYLKYVTIFSMYLADDVIDGGMFFIWKYPVLILAGVLLYWLSMRIFEKRDLPL